MSNYEDNRAAAAERETNLLIEGGSRGENVVYHIGMLSRDCEHGKPLQVATARGHRSGAWRCCKLGLCALVQRRIDANLFEYIAQRR